MRSLYFAAGLAATVVATAAAQQPATPPAPAGPPPLEVGTVAPDFTLPGATRFGALRAPIRLSDFKGKTVVLAFFFKARTRG
ncbi:MAG TPA: hypothetical protein VGJ83_07135 [Gemmatimonadales bacterium]|jgi:peroxiredoxin Q/BCP